VRAPPPARQPRRPLRGVAAPPQRARRSAASLRRCSGCASLRCLFAQVRYPEYERSATPPPGRPGVADLDRAKCPCHVNFEVKFIVHTCPFCSCCSLPCGHSCSCLASLVHRGTSASLGGLLPACSCACWPCVRSCQRAGGVASRRRRARRSGYAGPGPFAMGNG
jgi:hypothetical protein